MMMNLWLEVHAAWALWKIDSSQSKKFLLKRRDVETEDMVIEEIDLLLNSK